MADVNDFEGLANTLSMTELIRLQDVLSKALVRRFEKRLALVFTDVVGSTPYFARFGDEAGRKLQQRHFDLLNAVIAPEGGRMIDTAGDGAFMGRAIRGGGHLAVQAAVAQVAPLPDRDARADLHPVLASKPAHPGATKPK